MNAPKIYTNSIGMEFILCPAGTFIMIGATRVWIFKDERKKAEKIFDNPIRRVTLTRPFYIGKYPVTQVQWETVMGNNPSHFKGAGHPVEMVSWDDTQAFIKRLNTKEGHKRYRLPTEAEWEYAARGGTNTIFVLGEYDGDENDEEEINKYAWHSDNSGDSTHPVGQKKANPWGLYDVDGNVWEWAQDWYENELPKGEFRDYCGPASGSYRVIRGSSWFYGAGGLLDSSRDSYVSDYQRDDIGFCLVLSTE